MKRALGVIPSTVVLPIDASAAPGLGQMDALLRSRGYGSCRLWYKTGLKALAIWGKSPIPNTFTSLTVRSLGYEYYLCRDGRAEI